MTHAIFARLQRFLRDTRGNVTIETVIWVPLLLTIIAATFSLHDAFRYKALNTKAAYTISDALSRETDPIDDAYLDGMVDVLEFLTRSEGPYSLRVSLIKWHNPGSEDSWGNTTPADPASGAYQLDWSQTRGDFDALTLADLTEIQDGLPTMLHNERVILVETRTEYVPPFDIAGLSGEEMFYTYGFTRPRFAPKIVWSGGN